MKEKKPVKILERRLGKLREKKSLLSLELTGESLHAFRVEVKKLMALIRMLNTVLPPDQPMKAGKKFKTIYHFTGIIRNLELHEKRVLTYFENQHLLRPSSYLSILDDEKVKARASLKESLDDFSLHDFEHRLLADVPEQFNVEDCRNYLLQQKHVLNAVTISSGDEQIHETRKMLKDIGYNRKYLEACLDEGFPSVLLKKEETNALTEALGNFQDLCVALGYLDPLYLENLEAEEKSKLLELKEKLDDERKNLRMELIQRIMNTW